MKKLLGIVVLGLLLSSHAFAEKNKNTWDYPFAFYGKYQTQNHDP
jgi:hypothetical protein